MKKLITMSLMVLGFLSFTRIVKGATYTVGTGGNYASLYAAFDDINNGNIGGSIVLQITSNLVETNTCQIDFSGFGGSYTDILIYPTVPNLTVSANHSNHVIWFNGADNITIDGRVNASGTTPSLTIANSNTSASANSTIFLSNNSTNNRIQYCIISTNSSNSSYYPLRIAGATSAPGNSYNVIHGNVINGMAGTAGRAGACIGTTLPSSVTVYNVKDSITNNVLKNAMGAGIYTEYGCQGFYIANNSIFDEVADPSNINRNFIGIRYYQNTISDPATITNNYIGGSSPLCGGNPFTMSTSFNYGWGAEKSFTGINYTGYNGNQSDRATITNNVIQNILLQNVHSTYTFDGIGATGAVNVIGNLIGSTTVPNSIRVTDHQGTPNGRGIGVVGNNFLINSNTISGLLFDLSIGTNALFNGITANHNVNNSIGIVTNNSIGSTIMPNAISLTGDNSTVQLSATGIVFTNNSNTGSSTTIDSNFVSNISSQGINHLTKLHGIIWSNYNTSNVNIRGNKISKLSGGAYLRGIYETQNQSYNEAANILNNEISFLTSASTSSVVEVIGIFSYPLYNWNFTHGVQIKGNFIHDLVTQNVASDCYGLYLRNIRYGQISNNIVSLESDYGKLTGVLMYEHSNTKFLHNTVYVSSSTNRDDKSINLNLVTVDGVTYTNNIFYNGMANASGIVKNHFTINHQNVSNYGTNYNVYRVANQSSGGAVAYVFNNTTAYNNLNQWKFYTNKDTNSVSIDPVFVNGGGSNAADYYPTASVLGATYLGVSTDYFNSNRNTDFWMGAIQSTGPSAPLPLTWSSFTANDINNVVELKWTTKNEFNLSHFEIEYSNDGAEWNLMTTLPASNQENAEYASFDKSPFNGSRYYRIKQIDTDNKFSFTKVERVTRLTKSDINFYPNPCTMNLNVITSEVDPSYQLQVFSLDGKMLMTSSINSTMQKLDVSYLKAGTYFIKLFNKDKTITSKFTKQ